MSQVTTITCFRFNRFADKFWALSMMQLAHRQLSNIEGNTFYKLMGTGRGDSFNAFPDFSTYILLQVWRNEDDAKAFFARSQIVDRYRERASEVWTTYMVNVSSHGLWSGVNPFEPTPSSEPSGPVIAVTRATIKWQKLLDFWRYVPVSQKDLKSNSGLVYTKGMGELPIVQMATYSVWADEASLRRFAYESEHHRVAIAKTKTLKWYREELFARFQPIRSEGTWEGRRPLEHLL
ncbi:spheroidene monooxygenase [Imperialibacter sp.]|uniref:spheroidene monooxygenase n=1 Tax=Imperialibacter sp. TaxID=2038411 RepID=UPI0032ED201D